jgi:hypothetical protein
MKTAARECWPQSIVPDAHSLNSPLAIPKHLLPLSLSFFCSKPELGTMRN